MNSTFAQVNSQATLEKLPPRSLVFIDSGVEDYESIAAGVLPGQQVVILDRTKNGIEQITSEIDKYASTNGRSIQFTSFLPVVLGVYNWAIPLWVQIT